MRLLFVSRSLPFHHLGGMEAVAWDLARALAQRGHKIEILTTRTPMLEGASMREGVQIRTMDVRSGRYSAAYWGQTRDLFATYYRNRVDVVLGIGMGAYSIAQVHARSGRPPVLMQSHGQAWGELLSKLAVPEPLSWLKSPKNLLDLFRDRNLKYFDRVIAVGPAVEQVLRGAPTRWLLRDTPVSEISNGVDSQRFAFDFGARQSVRSSLSIGPSAPVMVSACRLHVQKGVRESLNGFAVARNKLPGLIYLIAGTGPAEGELRKHVERLGLAASVHFLGAIKREELPRVLSAADAFLFTSKRREGLALGPLEASAAGLPCVLSDHLSVPGLEAELVDPDDPEQVGAAIFRSISARVDGRASLLPTRYTLEEAAARYETCFSAEIEKAKQAAPQLR